MLSWLVSSRLSTRQPCRRPVHHSLVNSLESALPQNRRVTRLESADPKRRHLKSFRIRTYKNKGGWGVVRAKARVLVPHESRRRSMAGAKRSCTREDKRTRESQRWLGWKRRFCRRQNRPRW